MDSLPHPPHNWPDSNITERVFNPQLLLNEYHKYYKTISAKYPFSWLHFKSKHCIYIPLTSYRYYNNYMKFTTDSI